MKKEEINTWHQVRCLLIYELMMCKTKKRFLDILSDMIKIKKLEEE